MSRHLLLARPIRVVAAACVTSACDAQPRGVPSYQARDSSGIQIHEYDQAAFSAAPQWAVSATPVLDIGSGLENDPRYEFFQIEAMDRFSNGDFVVLTSGTREIRVYDSAGRYVRDIGRVGTGPGEFVAPRWLHVMEGDSLFVFDFNQHRADHFRSKWRAGSDGSGGSPEL